MSICLSVFRAVSVCLQRLYSWSVFEVRHGDVLEPGVSYVPVMQGGGLRLSYLKNHKFLPTGTPQSLADSATSKVALALRL